MYLRLFRRGSVAFRRHQIQHALHVVSVRVVHQLPAEDPLVSIRQIFGDPQGGRPASVEHAQRRRAFARPDHRDRDRFPGFRHPRVAGAADNDRFEALLPHLLRHRNHFRPPHRHGSIIVDSIRLIRDTAGLDFQEWEILFDQSAMELEQFRISRGQDADQPHPVLFHGDHPFADKILFI